MFLGICFSLAQASLELVILLPHPLRLVDYRRAPPRPATSMFLNLVDNFLALFYLSSIGHYFLQAIFPLLYLFNTILLCSFYVCDQFFLTSLNTEILQGEVMPLFFSPSHLLTLPSEERFISLASVLIPPRFRSSP
jgi:hypothetical protein